LINHRITVDKIRFENNTGKNIQICIEPLCEYIEWEAGKSVEIELSLTSNKFNDEFNFALTETALIIYECRQYEMKVYIDKDLKYITPPERYAG
jgi:hypothetical protein